MREKGHEGAKDGFFDARNDARTAAATTTAAGDASNAHEKIVKVCVALVGIGWHHW